MDANDYIQNPKTGRYIRKHGQVHRRLMKAGLLEKCQRLDQVELKEGDDVELEKKKLAERIPAYKKVVRYKDKLVVKEQCADKFFIDIIDKLLEERGLDEMPELPPKLTRQRGRYRVVEHPESSSDEEDEE